jgi:hypothetical protein
MGSHTLPKEKYLRVQYPEQIAVYLQLPIDDHSSSGFVFGNFML